MKRYVLIMLFGVLFVWPSSLLSQRLYLKPALGVSFGGRISDTWNPTSSAFEYTVAPAEKTSAKVDASLELVFRLNPSIRFSLGIGYVHRMEGLSGSEGQFSPPESSGLVNFSYTPGLDAEVFPLSLSAIYSHPFMLESRLNFHAGVGYYFGRFSCNSGNWWIEPVFPFSTWSRSDWEFKSDVRTVGFHAGISIEFDLQTNMVFFVETIYRGAVFKDFKTSAKFSSDVDDGAGVLEGGSTFFYAKGVDGGEVFGDIDYRVSNIDFSGMVFRIGIKFLLK